MSPPPPPKLERLNRISPSRFTQIRQCPLREAWQASKTPPLLPVAPATRLGSAAHRVLKLAAQARVTDLEQTWDDSVKHVEDQMREAGDGNLLPLRDTAQRYEVKKRLTFAAARTIVQACKAQPGWTPAEGKTVGAEVWLESVDGVLGGFVDSIIPGNGGPEILDYKTGAVTEHETGDVKEAYEVQLLLYAGLYHDKTGAWPTKLTLAALGGTEYDVPVDTARAQRLMEEARSTMHSLNKHIDSGNPPEQLARPGPKVCAFCTYWPACKRYWAERSHDLAWPSDAKGLLQSLTQLGNGTLRAIIDDPAGAVTVRGLSTERFTFLLERPPAVMLCNIRPDTTKGLYRQSRLTTGWALEE